MLEHILGQEWEIVPAGGATGEAFIAINGENKLFLKRNSSPFLAVLSAEGIVPKLVWTRRLESGDVITAQRWVNGRELSQEEMQDKMVARLLKKIHQSVPLRSMLLRMGKVPLKPEQLLNNMKTSLDDELSSISCIRKAVEILDNMLSDIACDECVVCHFDVNHNNWLLSQEDEQLFLIDWDGAMVADPAIDLGMLLFCYIPKEEWNAWLENYGVSLTDSLKRRMKWYVIFQIISSVQWHKSKDHFQEMDDWLLRLQSVIQEDQVY